METTPNYNLKKPGDEDFYNIEDFNDNVDVIDAELKRLNDAIGDLDADNITLPDGKTLTEKFDEIVSEVGELEELGTDTKSNVIAAINEIHQALVAHEADNASLTQKGHVQLQTAVDDSESIALTPKALKLHQDDDTRHVTTRNIDLQNLNDITETGTYNGSGMVNAPTSDWYYVEVIRHVNNSNFVLQKIQSMFDPNARYIRLKKDGIWNAWKRILNEDDYNQLFTFANDGKTAVANAITAKGVSASPSDTFAALATKIGQIPVVPTTGLTAGYNILYSVGGIYSGKEVNITRLSGTVRLSGYCYNDDTYWNGSTYPPYDVTVMKNGVSVGFLRTRNMANQVIGGPNAQLLENLDVSINPGDKLSFTGIPAYMVLFIFVGNTVVGTI